MAKREEGFNKKSQKLVFPNFWLVIQSCVHWLQPTEISDDSLRKTHSYEDEGI